MNNLTPEEREIGRDNYHSAVTAHDRMTRRNFMATAAAAGVAGVGMGGMYFGYGKPDRPVRVCVIGTGDEGSVLIGAINPDFVEVKSICDIRPSSVHRAFHGDWATPNTVKVRPGLMSVYGWNNESEAMDHVKVFDDYREAINDPDIEAVIIATPLFLHAPIAVAAMRAGKHVLCEKLMAHSVAECKLMARTAAEENMILSVGHQRHYSILYDNAVNLIKWGLLGELHHIRAQWHRNNRPGNDSWITPIPGGPKYANGQPLLDHKKKPIDVIKSQLDSFIEDYNGPDVSKQDVMRLHKQIAQWQAWDADKTVKAEKWGYEKLDAGGFYPDRPRSALEELVRWRVWDRTGGGLMAELGSHQLDAASIFISALAGDPNKHVHPLSVHAVGGRHTAPKDRDAADHVYCTFDFPGPGYDYNFDVGYSDQVNKYPPETGVPNHEQDPNKRIVVTYSSINGNGYGGYGEAVMGTKATMVLDREKDVMLYPIKGTSYKSRVKQNNKKQAIIDTSASGDAAPAAAAEGYGPVSRGYREEIEHWAWCIQQSKSGDSTNQPRCNGPVALADAVLALTARKAIQNSQKPGGHGFVQFQPEWFDVDSDSVPEADDAEANKLAWSKAKKNCNA